MGLCSSKIKNVLHFQKWNFLASFFIYFKREISKNQKAQKIKRPIRKKLYSLKLFLYFGKTKLSYIFFKDVFRNGTL